METMYEQLPSLRGMVSLSDPSWSLLHIQLRFGIKSSAAKRLVNEVGFPKPIINTERNRRWHPADIEKYVELKSRGLVEPTNVKQIKKGYEPKVVNFKKAN
jgi:predicted DNA-binding transcriptional regulator AlpA